MRSAETRYPVDRYLVESSKKFDMVNIIDDDIWNSEPALRPEDEIILRKLHDMLQSTADDLKLLSGELSKYHESDVQKKTLPTPLDEEFNEKVHIEEVVSVRFHGNKQIQPESIPRKIQKELVEGMVQSVTRKCNNKQYVSHGVQVNQTPILKKSPAKKNLAVSRTNIIQISKPVNKEVVNNNERTKKNNNRVTYNEFTYTHVEPKPTIVKKPLQIQKMPSINIRSELKEQKVVQLDIQPNKKEIHANESAKSNALVIEIKHENTPKLAAKKPITFDHISHIPPVSFEKPTTRKISKMSAYESESTNNVSSESQDSLRKKIKNSIALRKLQRPSHVVTQKAKKNITSKKDVKQEGKRNLDQWHKKLNVVYGGTSKLRSSGVKRTKVSPKKLDKEKTTINKKTSLQVLNNAEYIPYSKLTIGGVNVSDIEREISNIHNKHEIVLSPILDKILSRENSFHNDSPRKSNKNKILTTSDEDLLQEVLDIEKEISKSTKNGDNSNNVGKDDINEENNFKDGDSYDDDFEDEKSNDFEQANRSQVSKSDSSISLPPNNSNNDNNYDPNQSQKNEKDQKESENIHNKTYTKISNLSFKNTVDIFEFVHSIDTQDIATQSNSSNKVNQDNQTTSSDDKSNVQPIHNDLWPSIDPRGEVEKMFKLEKEFIKKLIIDEYGDLLEKQFNKPSTSKNIDNSSEKNVSSSQKNTQTSPSHVKSVMTSPTRTKTRTTSPFVLSQSVNQQTSPIFTVSKEEQLKLETEKEEELSISVNLSSPRFSLRLPQTTREVFSKNKSDKSYNRSNAKTKILPRSVSSSSSGAEDYSSSDISSLGQIHKIYKRRLRKYRLPSTSEISSSSSSLSRYSRYSSNRSGVLPLKSEGEASIGVMINKISNKNSKSEGEVSLGQLN